MKAPVKIGMVLSGLNVPMWIYRIMENISASEFASVSLIILFKQKEQKKNWTPAFYRLHEKLDKLIFNNRIDYLNSVNIGEIYKNVPVLPFDFNPKELMTEIQPDVILNFNNGISAKKWEKYARFGVWTYNLGTQNQSALPASCYWETVKSAPVISTWVNCSDGRSVKQKIIHKSWISANYNSFHINQNNAYGIAAFIFPQLLKGVYNSGKNYLLSRSEKYMNFKDKNDILEFLPLRNSQAIRNMGNLVLRYFNRKLVYKNQFKWFLMVKKSNNPFHLKSGKYLQLNPPKDRFWADPFIVLHNEKYYVFAEEFVYRKNKGHIVWLELSKNGKLLRSEKILERPYHMSYPFVFEHDGQYYMIPETSENRTVELYKSTDFPAKWEFVMNLMDSCNAVDTTLFYHDKKWWLFSSLNEFSGFPDHRELFLYYSDSLFSTQWKSHPGNPVVTDVRTARPGGRVFIHKGKIYRPSQDCSVRYGRALNLNEITRLTEQEYAEKRVKKWEPDWYPKLKGIHTLNFDKNLTVIDGYKFFKRFDFFSNYN